MVFDLTSRETFMKLAKWVTEIKEQAAHGIVIIQDDLGYYVDWQQK